MPPANDCKRHFLYLINPWTWINSFLSSPRSMLADADMPDKLQELPYRFQYNRSYGIAIPLRLP